MEKTELLSNTRLSVRSINALENIGVKTVEQILNYTEDVLLTVNNLGVTSVAEILSFIKDCTEYFGLDNTATQNIEQWAANNGAAILQYAKENDIAIVDMNLSAKAFNILRINDCQTLSQFVAKTNAELLDICFDNRSVAEEITLHIRKWLSANRDKISPKQSNTIETKTVKSDAHLLNQPTDSISNDIPVASAVEDEYLRHVCIQYALQHNVPIEELNLSTRTFNCLKRNKINTLSEMISHYPNGYVGMKNLGAKSVDEIQRCINLIYLNCNNAEEHSLTNDNTRKTIVHSLSTLQLLNNPNTKEHAWECIKNNDIPIELMGLSNRSIHALTNANITYFSSLLEIYPRGLSDINNLGRTSLDEIKNAVNSMLEAMRPSIIAHCSGDEEKTTNDSVPLDSDEKNKQDINTYSSLQLFFAPNTKERALEYVKNNDIAVSSLCLSQRSEHALLDAQITHLSSILEIYPSGLASIRNLGGKSLEEIKAVVNTTLKKIKPSVVAYCGGNANALFSDQFIRDTIINRFNNKVFTGVSFHEMRNWLSETIDEERIKKTVGKLIHDGVLEYVDFRCYRTYPSFFAYFDKISRLADDANAGYLLRRYNGETLESIAKSEGITRERIRQKCNKYYQKIKNAYLAETGLNYFDEDYYAYLYSTYLVSKDFFQDWLHLHTPVWLYLKNTYEAGTHPLDAALNDSQIDLNLRLRIRDYLDRDKIVIGGELILPQKSAVEEYILEHYCKDEVTFNDFVRIFNDVLRENNVADIGLFLTDDTARTRSNHLADSKKCLWKQGERLRYYDIASKDYTELLETLNLGEYANIEISTLKFMEDYQEIMEKYDIRDHYELHNLLKKVIGNDADNDIHFSRQPIIAFGQTDRVELYRKILYAVAPVTAEEFAAYIHKETGFDKQTLLASSEIQQLSRYYHNGIYSIDFKQFPDEHTGKLCALLDDDFYYIDEIVKIYTDNFTNADTECINPRSLKAIGFTVFSDYVLKNYSTAEAYFKAILTKDDIFDITPYNTKYGKLGIYSQSVTELRKEHEIFLFESNQYINYRKLSKAGITKQMIEDYCQQVTDVVQSGTYFTIQLLRNDGFSHSLDDFGFDDIFYAGILSVSPFFSYQRVYGNIVLYNGNDNSQFSIKKFIQNLLADYDGVDVDDFMNDIYEKYGIKIPDKYAVTGAVTDTEMYYDSIMNKIYPNKEQYYSDLDD